MLFLRRGERGFICGTSGNGKTFAACWLLHYAPVLPLYIIDTKGDSNLPKAFPYRAWHNTAEKFLAEKKAKVRIYTPEIDELKDEELLDGVLQEIFYRRKPATVYVDECLDIVSNSGNVGSGIVALATRGRSHGISLLAGTQRPANVTRYLISEASHYYIFNLNLRADRKAIAENAGIEGETPHLKKQHFLHIEPPDVIDRFSAVPGTIDRKLRERFKPE
jgi:hypothetical protein